MWFGDTVEIVFIMVGGGCVCESKGFSSCWHVPQSILNSTSLLSDMLWQMLSSFELYIYGPKGKYSILLAWYGEDGRIEQAYCLSGGGFEYLICSCSSCCLLSWFLLFVSTWVRSFCSFLSPFLGCFVLFTHGRFSKTSIHQESLGLRPQNLLIFVPVVRDFTSLLTAGSKLP